MSSDWRLAVNSGWNIGKHPSGGQERGLAATEESKALRKGRSGREAKERGSAWKTNSKIQHDRMPIFGAERRVRSFWF